MTEAKATPDFAHEGSKETLTDKVGYGPLGETPGKNDSMFGWAWQYDHKDASTQQIQYKRGACRST